jgi:hypothetical protein
MWHQLEENIPTFQASDILNAFFLLLRTQQKYLHGQLPFPNRSPVLPSLADPHYSSRESPF